MLEYEKKAYNIALRLTGNSEDAADVVQEAFLKAFKSLSSFRQESSFASWFYRIVTNLCTDLLRSRKPTASLTMEDDDGEDMELEIPDTSASPEELLEQKLTRESVRRGLDSLPPDSREILLLREIQGLSYDEIGTALNLDSGTVKSRIFRARKKLCSFLLSEGNIPDRLSSSKRKEAMRYE